MLTTIEVYACFAVKIYKNKPTNIFKQGGARLDPPLELTFHINCIYKVCRKRYKTLN